MLSVVGQNKNQIIFISSLASKIDSDTLSAASKKSASFLIEKILSGVDNNLFSDILTIA